MTPTGCWDSGAGTCSPQIQNTTRQINAQKISKDAWCDALSTRSSNSLMPQLPTAQLNWWTSVDPIFLAQSLLAEIHMCVGFSPNAP